VADPELQSSELATPTMESSMPSNWTLAQGRLHEPATMFERIAGLPPAFLAKWPWSGRTGVKC